MTTQRMEVMNLCIAEMTEKTEDLTRCCRKTVEKWMQIDRSGLERSAIHYDRSPDLNLPYSQIIKNRIERNSAKFGFSTIKSALSV